MRLPMNPKKPLLWMAAGTADFAATDVNAPLAGSATVDCIEISRLYGEASKNAGDEPAQARSFAMLGAVCSFHFKPNERDEPFGPMCRSTAWRSAQPSDFAGLPAEALAAQIARLENPAARARVADVVWLLNRENAAAGVAALAAYVQVVESVRDGSGKFRLAEAGVDTHEVVLHLRRGMQIARTIGWDSTTAASIRQLTQELRVAAANGGLTATFRRLATLDLDYSISAPAELAAQAERLAGTGDRHSLLHIAGRAYRRAGQQSDADRCLLAAAESLVPTPGAGDGSAMNEAHWLEKAIAELQNLPNTKERRRQLKHQLVDAQSRIIDEMTHFSHRDDISEIVAAAREAVSGKPLMAAIRAFASLSVAPTPEHLEEDARVQISENPLSSIFVSTTYDTSGKPVHRDPGMEEGSDGGVQRMIAQAEGIRRNLTAQGQVEPARLIIMTQHYVGEEVIGFIVHQSPFVPQDRNVLFASGILHFFQGDMVAALHTLVPQLENSLRQVLRLHGHDVTKLNEDMTQQDLSLSAMLDRLRPQLTAIFGARMITDIDNVFNYPGGPNLRNRLAHGSLPEWVPFGADSVYACWLIFQLCCIPLLRRWDELTSLYDSNS